MVLIGERAEVLESLCGDQLRESVAAPFSFELDGSWWDAATNGSGLVALKADSGSYLRANAPPAGHEGSVCPDCEGDGGGYRRLPIDFEHMQFDRVLAARYLAPFADHEGDVAVFIGGELDPIEFRAAEWRVLLMPMRRTEGNLDSTGQLPSNLIRKA